MKYQIRRATQSQVTEQCSSRSLGTHLDSSRVELQVQDTTDEVFYKQTTDPAHPEWKHSNFTAAVENSRGRHFDGSRD